LGTGTAGAAKLGHIFEAGFGFSTFLCCGRQRQSDQHKHCAHQSGNLESSALVIFYWVHGVYPNPGKPELKIED
jgi:hypothetical protein